MLSALKYRATIEISSLPVTVEDDHTKFGSGIRLRQGATAVGTARTDFPGLLVDDLTLINYYEVVDNERHSYEMRDLVIKETIFQTALTLVLQSSHYT